MNAVSPSTLPPTGKRWKMPQIRATSARLLVGAAMVLAVAAGAVFQLGWGTLSVFGPEGFSAICPLGWLEVGLASRSWPAMWLPFVLTLVAVVVLGRYFCAWICPAALLQNVAGWRGAGKAKHASPLIEEPPAPAVPASTLSRRMPRLDSRFVVLGGTLLSAAVFGFPVFCLICPIGLFFGTLFALGHLFSFQQPSIDLVLFPAIIAVELLTLKNWCRSICPLGALLSLGSSLNRFFRPVVDKEKCLASKGINCQACRNVCAYGVDPRRQPDASGMECVKCLECSDRCPVKAIRFPFRA